MQNKITNYEYLKSKVVLAAEDNFSLPWYAYPCINWDRGGGEIWTGQEYVQRHVLAYTHARGKFPDGMYVVNLCDNQRCIRPSHMMIHHSKRISLKLEYLKSQLAKLTDDYSKPWHYYPCLPWPHGADSLGYGSVSFNGKPCHVTRVAYELVIGPIPEGHDMCHHCDNPPCYRPIHLFSGKELDNMRDMREKGRDNYLGGQDHPMATLNDAAVREIRKLSAEGHSHNSLVSKFGVSKATISSVVLRKTWKNV